MASQRTQTSRVCDAIAAVIEEAVERHTTMSNVKYSMRKVSVGHCCRMSPIDCLDCIDFCNGTVGCEAKPHLHVAGVRKRCAIPADCLLTTGSRDSCWRRN